MIIRAIHLLVVTSLTAAFLTAPSAASARLLIKSEFIPSDPPPNIIGGGNLVEIFKTAAATWE
jgi:hypothetical protein